MALLGWVLKANRQSGALRLESPPIRVYPTAIYRIRYTDRAIILRVGYRLAGYSVDFPAVTGGGLGAR